MIEINLVSLWSTAVTRVGQSRPPTALTVVSGTDHHLQAGLCSPSPRRAAFAGKLSYREMETIPIIGLSAGYSFG